MSRAGFDGDHQTRRSDVDGGAEEVPDELRERAVLRSASAFFAILRRGARPPVSLIVDYVDPHQHLFGVEPICTALTSADVPIAPSTYYAARRRPPSRRAVRDQEVKTEIHRVHTENYGVYGIRKGLRPARPRAGRGGRAPGGSVRRGPADARARAARGVADRSPRTTVPATGPDPHPDLVERGFTATGQDRLWVADITSIRTFAGWVYAAFVLDVFSRRVVGASTSTASRSYHQAVVALMPKPAPRRA